MSEQGTTERPVLEVEGLVKHFPIHGGLLQRRTGEVKAVDGVSFSIARGETLGLVGESGCGKSTIGKTVLKLIEPTSGRIVLAGQDISSLAPGAMWEHRRRIQTIFQDPYSSMNPRLASGTIVGEPLENFGLSRGRETVDRVARLFERVGLRPDAMRKYAHEFSGGQRQRLGIAKALSGNPERIVAAEPGSSATITSGLTASALAMPNRWRWPPENSWAYLRMASGLSPTRSNRRATRSSVSRPLERPKFSSGSPTMVPAARRGFIDE